MKTPALEQALLPLRGLVAEALARYETEMRSHAANALIHSQRKKLAEKKITACLTKSDEKAARAAAEAVIGEEQGHPVLRRYEVNDSTVAKLGELLAQNPNGLLIHRDELVGFLRSLDKEGNEEARAFYLEAWNGTGSFTFDRIGRGTVRIPSNTVSLIGGIQPDLLTGFVREAVRGGVGADGLLQRFQLAVWPDVSKEWRNVDRWPDTKSKNDAFEAFNYLDELTPEAVGASASREIPFLRFANDAQERFDLWRSELESRIRNDTEHPAFEGHLSKYRKLVPALALLIHLANRDTGPVSLTALEKACLWAIYLEEHARRIYSAVLRPDAAAARELAKHLERSELAERFTLREIYRRGWAGIGSKEDAEAATEILCDLGWIRAVPDTGRTSGRPPSPVFEVNPNIRDTARSEPTEPTKPISGSSVSDAAGARPKNDQAAPASTNPS
jgi:putative DNA primase/helicase